MIHGHADEAADASQIGNPPSNTREAKMDWWLIKQLRARVLADLQQFLPADFLEADPNLQVHGSLEGAAHFSSELNWGQKAGKLGLSLYFHSDQLMTPRQVSASEVLMHLGLLAGAEAAEGATRSLAKFAQDRGVSDGNAGQVSADLGQNKIPTLEDNLRGGLKLYLHYLPDDEKSCFAPLLERTSADIDSAEAPSSSLEEPGKSKTRDLRWIDRLPGEAPKQLLTEIYFAADNGLRALTAMGVRTVVDILITSELGDIGGFEKKLKKLRETGQIGVGDLDVLTGLVEAGNASAHRGYMPDEAVIENLLELVEHIVRSHYLHKKNAIETIRNSTPARAKRPEF